MQCRREVGFENARRYGLQQAWDVTEGFVDIGGEAALDVMRAKLAEAGRGTGGRFRISLGPLKSQSAPRPSVARCQNG